MIAGTVVFMRIDAGSTSAESIWYDTRIDFAELTDAEIRKLIQAQRSENRRIVPPAYNEKIQQRLIVSPLIRWMAKALIGGQK